MKVRSLLWSALCMLALSVTLTSCSDDDDDLDDSGSIIELPQHRAFILYEGIYEKSNAGIAFYAPDKDAKNSENNFISDIYSRQNNKKLGDTGQDIMKYEDKIYVIVSGSKLLLRLNAAGVEEARLSLEEEGEPRGMEAEDGKIYVTLYSGKVARIDANTLNIEAYVNVGANPEQIVEEKGKLYVANSGWGNGNTVSVIDIATFTKEKDIEVAQNPNLLLEANDEISLISWAVTWGASQSPQVFQRIKSDGTVESITNANYFAEHDEIIYLINGETTDWGNNIATNEFLTYNAKTHQLNTISFLKNVPAKLSSAIIKGINIDDRNGDIYILAYSSNITNGDVYRFKSDGTFLESFDCGGLYPHKVIFF